MLSNTFLSLLLLNLIAWTNANVDQEPVLKEIEIEKEHVTIHLSPHDSSSSLEHFIVSLYPNEGDPLQHYTNITVPGDPGTYEFRQLGECVQYMLNVTGYDRGRYTPLLQETFINWPKQLPPAPRDLTFNQEDGINEIKWTIPDGAADIKHTVVDIANDQGEHKGDSQAGYLRSYVLKQCGNFTLTFHSTNGCGYSQEPESIRVQIPTPAPTNLRANVTDPYTAIVEWDAPEFKEPHTFTVNLKDRNGSVTSYNLLQESRSTRLTIVPGEPYEVNVTTRSRCGLSHAAGPVTLSGLRSATPKSCLEMVEENQLDAIITSISNPDCCFPLTLSDSSSYSTASIGMATTLLLTIVGLLYRAI